MDAVYILTLERLDVDLDFMSKKRLQIHQVRIGENGRVRIPAVLRKRHGLRLGDQMEWRLEAGGLLLTVVRNLERIKP